MAMAVKTILTSDDVPKYIREIASRLVPDKSCKGGIWGCNFRLYAKWPRGYVNQFQDDVQKLLAWCRRHYATAELVEWRLWYHRHPDWDFRNAERAKARNYAIITITDPVALRFEKDGFYKGRGKK